MPPELFNSFFRALALGYIPEKASGGDKPSVLKIRGRRAFHENIPPILGLKHRFNVRERFFSLQCGKNLCAVFHLVRAEDVQKCHLAHFLCCVSQGLQPSTVDVFKTAFGIDALNQVAGVFQDVAGHSFAFRQFFLGLFPVGDVLANAEAPSVGKRHGRPSDVQNLSVSGLHFEIPPAGWLRPHVFSELLAFGWVGKDLGEDVLLLPIFLEPTQRAFQLPVPELNFPLRAKKNHDYRNLIEDGLQHFFLLLQFLLGPLLLGDVLGVTQHVGRLSRLLVSHVSVQPDPLLSISRDYMHEPAIGSVLPNAVEVGVNLMPY